MNQLHQLMLEELQRRNFAAATIRTYLQRVDRDRKVYRVARAASKSPCSNADAMGRSGAQSGLVVPLRPATSRQHFRPALLLFGP